MKGFVSIKDLVTKAEKQFSYIYKSLAEEIDANGIYELDIVRNPNTRGVQDALSSLAALYMLEYEVKTPSFDYAMVEAAAKRADIFGWPSQKVPDFKDSSELGWIKNYVSFDWHEESVISHAPPFRTWQLVPKREIVYFEELTTISRILLTDRASTAAIACEIENNGVFGFGLGGRMEHYSLGTWSDCEDILVGLTEFSKVLRGTNPSFEMLRKSIFSQYGWPHELMPSFSMGSDVHVWIKSDPDRGSIPVDSEQPTSIPSDSSAGMVQQATLSVKSKSNWPTTPETYQKVICGLLCYITGEFGQKHPEYKTYSRLRHTLDEESGSDVGLKKDGLKKIFADALKHKENYGVDPEEVEQILDSSYARREIFGVK
jgi:hypothetical protein